MRLDHIGIVMRKIAKGDARILTFGRPRAFGVPWNDVSERPRESRARQRGLAELKNVGQKIPPVVATVSSSAWNSTMIGVSFSHLFAARAHRGITGLIPQPCVLHGEIGLREQRVELAGMPVPEAPLAART